MFHELDSWGIPASIALPSLPFLYFRLVHTVDQPYILTCTWGPRTENITSWKKHFALPCFLLDQQLQLFLNAAVSLTEIQVPKQPREAGDLRSDQCLPLIFSDAIRIKIQMSAIYLVWHCKVRLLCLASGCREAVRGCDTAERLICQAPCRSV